MTKPGSPEMDAYFRERIRAELMGWSGNDVQKVDAMMVRLDAIAAEFGPSPVDDEVQEASMPRVNGKPFRCHCGGNVFAHRKSTDVFTCQSCNEQYQGTR